MNAGDRAFIISAHREVRATRWSMVLAREVDCTSAERLRRGERAAGRPAPTWAALAVAAQARALRRLIAEHPELNAMVAGWGPWRRLHAFPDIAVLVIASGDAGDIEPLIVRDADRRPWPALAAELRGARTSVRTRPEAVGLRRLKRLPPVVQRWCLALGARSLRLAWDQRGSSGFTSVGGEGVDLQCSLAQTHAIEVRLGAVRQRAIVRDGAVVAAPTAWLSVGFDRRLVCARPAARLLAVIATIIEDGVGAPADEEFAVAEEAMPAAARG